MDSDSSELFENELKPVSQKNWFASVCSYFRDFLDTDFKKSRAPKRSIVSRDRTGLLTGIPISNYPELNRDIVELLSKPFVSNMTIQINVRRGKYRSRLSESILSIIKKQVTSVSIEDIEIIKIQTKEEAREFRNKFSDDHERFSDMVLGKIKNNLLLAVVNPLLTNLDTHFKNKGLDGLESIFNIEEELGLILISSVEDGMKNAVATAIVKKDFSEIDNLIDDACSIDLIRIKIINFFDSFSTKDFFNDLSQLRSTLKLKENFQIYIYACALWFGKSSYPLFYFPVEVKLFESVFTIKLDPHLLINKKVVDYAVSETSNSIGHQVPFSVAERIIYVSQGESLFHHAQVFLDDFTSALSLNNTIDLREFRKQKAFRSQFIVSNDIYFAAFDQSDESMLNDYEELLEQLNSGSEQADDFNELIKKFMFLEPESFEENISEEWVNLEMPERLVYDSPVPLNEEQRKIISGINKDNCNFISVEGPPGTGKSHTITACVFDAILKGKNVLVLSDKKEALDVAEKKIRETLSAVRLNKDLQDPILRLGKHGNTYTKIISPKTIDQLKRANQVAKSKENEFEKGLVEKQKDLKAQITLLSDKSSAIDMTDIVGFHKEEEKFDELSIDVEEAVRNNSFCSGIINSNILVNYFNNPEIERLLSLLDCSIEQNSLKNFFNLQTKIYNVSKKINVTKEMLRFGKFKSSQLNDLGNYIDEYEKAKKPIIGFLFSKNKIIGLNRVLTENFDYEDIGKPGLNLISLKEAEKNFRKAISTIEEFNFVSKKEIDACLHIAHREIVIDEQEIVIHRNILSKLMEALGKDEEKYFESVGLSFENISVLGESDDTDFIKRIKELSEHIKRYNKIKKSFDNIPPLDYSKEKHDIEEHQTQKLANILDRSVVTFANEQKNKAAQIKTIIKKKQKFPQDLFLTLQKAFPIIIAGIRDYAEYVPLEKDLFDLIIIDEASQVSIAQALPAFVRSKKVLVLGDQNQFSNVKTENASKAINQSYKSRIMEQFLEEENQDIAMQNQIALFDIKTSVIEFVDRIANLKIMLRKHFRGYPELISFSSKYFYGGDLQAVKIRGKSVDKVISFEEVPHDGLIELKGNTNQPEVEAIVQYLEEIVQKETPPDVCIITPHNEQQRLIWQTILSRSDSNDIIEKLKLRVFTFDTCQGEEAHTVIYSMVATIDRDRLNYIFARDMNKSVDVEDNLRLQRLNVGFSRAKERIIIYHSKPFENFSGGIQVALNHYKGVVEKSYLAPEVSEVDQSSPMEKKVLNWLRQVPIIDELKDQIEIDAQFEIGKYLKQLDETYKHPNYKVDFLIKVKGESKTTQIILEYDGFKEHFENLDEVNINNYQHYMKPADIERQKILEGYGYKFLRINRFNIGRDPIKTIDTRLRLMIENLDFSLDSSSLIEEQKILQESLSTGESRTCKKCEKIKTIDDYYDESLNKGRGGYGYVCFKCKGIPRKIDKNKPITRPSSVKKVKEDKIISTEFPQKSKLPRQQSFLDEDSIIDPPIPYPFSAQSTPPKKTSSTIKEDHELERKKIIVVEGVKQDDEELREVLQNFNEEVINIQFPKTDSKQRFLRPKMLDEIVKHRPTTRDEFHQMIPQYLRQSTLGGEFKIFIDSVLEIVSEFE